MPKLWINERESIDVPAPQLLSERATRQSSTDGFWSFLQHLPNPDPILKSQGKDAQVYKDLLSDGHLGGAYERRKDNVLKLEWEIDRGKAKSRQAKAIQQMWENLPMRRIISEMLDAWYYGYQPLEVLFSDVNGVIVPRDIVGKPQRWFTFSPENRLRFLSRTAPISGEDAPPPNFHCVQHQATYENPYGFPTASRCFWPITFKKGGVRFLVKFVEKFGMPWISATYPDGWKQEQIDSLFTQLQDMVQDALLVAPKSTEVQVSPTGSSANAEIYKLVVDWANSEISKAIFGHGSASDSTSGKLGNETGAESSIDTKTESDAGLVMDAMDTIIRWTTSLNWGSAVSPRFVMYEKNTVDIGLAQRDAILYGMGWRPTMEYFVKNHGMSEEDFTLDHAPVETEPPPIPPAEAKVQPPPAEGIEEEPTTPTADEEAFADLSPYPDQNLIDEISDTAILDTKEEIDRMLKPVREFLEGKRDYTVALDGLSMLFPKMNTKQLEKKMTQLLFMADVVGRISVEEELRNAD